MFSHVAKLGPIACVALLAMLACDFNGAPQHGGAPRDSDARAAGAVGSAANGSSNGSSNANCTGVCNRMPDGGAKPDAATAPDAKDAASAPPAPSPSLDAGEDLSGDICGNGTLNPNREDCDDGNRKDGDGCSATCRIAPGFYCALPGMPCYRPGDPDCSASACGEQGVCAEPSGLACRCPVEANALEPCANVGVRSLGLAEGGVSSRAYAISRDGTTLVGYVAGINSVSSAAIWTATDGLRIVPTSPADGSAVAVASSDQGTLVAVQTGSAIAAVTSLWNGTQLEPFVSPGLVTDISADGSVIVGMLGTVTAPDVPAAFRWTEPSGFDTFVPVPPDNCNADDDAGAAPCPRFVSGASAVSADGSLIVGGSSRQPVNPRAPRLPGSVFLWSAANGIRELPSDSFGLYGGANDLSDDGSVLVGVYRSHTDSWAARQTSAGVERLTPAPMHDATSYEAALAVSADGNVIVGMGAGQAMIWAAHEPPRFLRDVLADDGVDVSDWRFDMALDISADGKLIAGNGYCQGREVGFVARLR